MSLFLSLHAIAAKRGDGLHPELRALLERQAASPLDGVRPRSDGMVQSGPDPATPEATASSGAQALRTVA